MAYKSKSVRQAYHASWYAKNKSSVVARIGRNNTARKQYIREWIIAYLVEHPCVDCGEPDVVVLDFDHVSGVKTATVCALAGVPCSDARIKAEIAKCVVRCANCHRRKTAREGNWFKHRKSQSS